MDKELKKVVLLIPDLKAGGTQKVASSILDLELEECDVNIIVLTGGFARKNSDKIKFLNANRVLKSLWRLLLCLRSNKPDVIIVFMDIALISLFTIRPFISVNKVIYRPSSIPGAMNAFYNMGKLRRAIELLAIWFLGVKIWCQSIEQKSQYTHFSFRDVFVLGNFSTVNFESSNHKVEPSLFLITRNSPEKGVKRALEILSKDKTKWIQLNVYGIIDNLELRDLCERLKIAEKVNFKGYVSQEEIFQSEKGIFMQSSFIEAFPNALLEAIVAGFRTIALPCVGATSELLSYCNHTMLVTEEDFFACFDLLLSKQIDQNGLLKLKQRYSAESFKNKLQSIIN